MLDRRLSGVLSNWERIEAQIRIGIHDDPGTAKDLQDIIDIIHDLQDTAQTVSPLRELFNKHLTNTKNPHNVSIEITDLDVIAFLYDVYITKYGALMTLSDFTLAIVNIKRFATREDIDAGTHLQDALNINTMGYLISRHNDSPTAHNDLFRYKLPGIPIKESPSFVFEPSISMIGQIDVVRNCPMNYHDINGKIKTAAVDELVVDYSYGIPAVPIFSDKRNIMLNSRSLSDVGLIGSFRNGSGNPFILTPENDQRHLCLIENVGLNRHGFRDILTEEITGLRGYTLYCFPIDRDAVSFELIDSSNNLLGTALFNLSTEQCTFVPDELTKALVVINKLPNGWVRCHIGFDATNQSISYIDVSTLKRTTSDEYGIAHYDGENINAMAFWQHQLTEGILPVPPIFTDLVPVTILATKISRPFDELFNPAKGTIHFKYISPLTEIFHSYSQILRIGYNDPIKSFNNRTSVEVMSNPLDASRNRIISYNEDDAILSIIDSEPYLSDIPSLVKRTEFTYTFGYHGYGFTDNSPHIFRHYDPETGNASIYTAIGTVNTMTEFFGDIYPSLDPSGITAIQYESENPIGLTDPEGPIITTSEDLTSQYRINSNVNILEIGFNSLFGKYLEGYLLNFRYYPVFSSRMNLEFLLDQYIPEIAE